MTNAIVPNLTTITPERSSNIASMGFADGLLFVQFRRGALYVYDNVTAAEYAQLEAAKRISDVFGTLIKGVKPYRKVTGTTQQPDSSMPASAPAAPVAPAKTTSTNVVPFRGGAAPALPKETDDLATAATQWAAKATAVEIKDVPTHEQAQKVLLELDTLSKRIVETWKPMKAAAFAAHRAVCDKENELLAPLKAADKVLRARIGEYTYAQLRAAQAEDERKRQIAEEEARQRSIREADDNALAAAEELIAMGDHEGADAVLSNPMPASIRYEMPAPVKPAVAAVSGVGGGLAYEVTIVNLAEVPREYLVVDLDKTITEIARRAKQAAGRLQVPGTTIRETYATRKVGGRRG